MAPQQQTPSRAPEPTQRSWLWDVRIGSGLNLLVGGWLVLAPFVLGYSTTSARFNDVVVGVAIATLASWRLMEPRRTPQISWINAALGLWLIGWTLWTFRSEPALWNDLVVGGLVFIGGVVSATATETRQPAAPNARRRRRSSG